MRSNTAPRYSVELTAEGWQIKDNVKGHIRADVFRMKRNVLLEVERLNRVDAAEGEGRR